MSEPWMNDYGVTETMIQMGGSFVQSLGRLFRCADESNQARLKAAFPEIWLQYQELARLQHARSK